MGSVFTKIINREIPGHIVAETDDFIAFLDVMPLVMGHVLVVPKKEIDYIFDLDDATLAAIHVFAKKVAHAIQEVVPCKRIGVAVIGLEVPHSHIHLVPMNKVGDINFTASKIKPESDALSALAKKISAAISPL